jgi:K+-transporting ATPase ATPase A chain
MWYCFRACDEASVSPHLRRFVNIHSAIQYLFFVAVVTILVKPLGGYMERVFSRKRTVLDRLCVPVERLIYRLTEVDPVVEMSGKR